MKITILLLATLLSLHLNADELRIKDTAYRFIKINIGNGKPHFLELGAKDCHGCQVMGAKLYQVSKKNPYYNISYVDIAKDREVGVKLNVSIIPTQIIYDAKGKEVYRHTGIMKDDELLKVFKVYKF